MKNSTIQQPKIAVVGVSALFPGSQDAEGFWSDILSAKDLLTDVPKTHWLTEDYYDPDPSAPDKTYAKRGGFLDSVEFDPMKFGMPPSIAPATDTAQLLGLIVAQRVLEDACGGQFSEMNRDKCSIILGVTSAQELLATMVSRLQRPVWTKSLREAGIEESKVQEVCDRISGEYLPWQESTFPGLLGNVVAGRIANRLDLGGTNCVTDAACASSLSALSMAVNELTLGQSDMVITGGVDTMNDIFMYMCFSKTPALSLNGDCRPFSDAADGTMLGEGLGMIALKRLDDAERDGDRIYAVVTGIGSSSDGRAKSVYAPRPEGQAKAIQRAYDVAGYSTDTVEFVEAHGTGTKAGDVAEFSGLKLAFDSKDASRHQWCALGSVKSQIGHTKAAAGAAGLFKAVMALHHKVIPPTIKIDQPNPKLNIAESPFYLNTSARPWVRGADHPRRASVSSFGFGGSNFHVALEEYTGSGKKAWRKQTGPWELVLLSGGDAAGLLKELREIKITGREYLKWFARASQESFSATHTARLSIVASGDDDLRDKLQAAITWLETHPDEALSRPDGVEYQCGAPRSGEVGLLFSGQGSQYVSMGAELSMHFEPALDAWDRAANVEFGEGVALADVVFPKPAFDSGTRETQQTTLRATQWAQPAIGVTALAQLNLLEAIGVKPSAVAGHSFGEVVALHAAGAMDAESMIKVARRRGELMAAAASVPGAMSAVSSSGADVQAVLDELKTKVVIANYNSLNQTVISGTVKGVEAVEEALGSRKMKFTRLPVATAFHSEVVSSSSKPFAAFLKDVTFKRPVLPVYSNTSAKPYPKTANAMRRVLADQLSNPVHFVGQVEAMYEAGIRTFVEVGPNAVLTNLVGQILKGKEHQAVNLDRKGKSSVCAFLCGVGRLAVEGVVVDTAPLWASFEQRVDPASITRPPLVLEINGANLGKIYPPVEGGAGLPPPNPEKEPEVVVKEVIKEVIKEVVREVPVAAPISGVDRSHHDATALQPEVSMGLRNVSDDVSPWLGVYRDVQDQTAQTHALWQKSMADTHQSFLASMETSLAQLSAIASGQVPHELPAAPVSAQPIPLAAPRSVEVAPVVPAVVTPTPAPVVPEPVVVTPSPAPIIEAEPSVVAPAPQVAAPGIDIKALMLDVVAEKTGYPAEMLKLEMSLEADLGIDSIKRVEILSALTERAPGMPEPDNTAMTGLQTVGEIVDYLDSLLGDVASVAVPAVAAPTSAPGVDIKALMLDVVAEKTGYPVEMLKLEMSLEADLGIDSIKRVEILSALTERAPGMPEPDNTAMTGLQTVGEIIEYLDSLVGTPVVASAPAAPAPGVDINALMFDVVAEKTGYPVEMLKPDMSLEADLGIDSIKRVEILSALTERAPGMPEPDNTAMTGLQTVGEIVTYLETLLGGEPSVAATATAEPEVFSELAVDRFILKAVEAAPTGFAVPGLTKASCIAITPDASGVGRKLKKLLGERGVKAELTDSVGPQHDGVIFLGGLVTTTDVDELLSVNHRAFEAASAVASTMTRTGGVFVTVQSTGGQFGLSDINNAWTGGLTGLVKTAAQEWPLAGVKAIDVQGAQGRDAGELAQVIADEICAGGAEIEVGLGADGKRYHLESVSQAVESSSRALPSNAVWVVSGGARGVTAATVIALAQKGGGRFALLGRTRLEQTPTSCEGVEDSAGLKRVLLKDAKAKGEAITPKALGKKVQGILAIREINQTLKALSDAGAEGAYFSVDVTDTAAMASTLKEIRGQWGPVKGVIHGAGVLADKLIADKTQEEFNRVFHTKIGGLVALLEGTKDDPIEQLVLFSSVAARAGNPGQCDYAMANEILNKVAAAQSVKRGNACVVKSFNWGPWAGGMVTPELRRQFEARGVPLIPIEEGARRMVDELISADRTNLEITIAGKPTLSASEAAKGDAAREFDVIVNAESHAFLSDHCVDNAPVVPVVLVMEWFMRAASAIRPDLHCVACQNVKVLKGIVLEDLNTPSVMTIKSVHTGTSGSAEITMECVSQNGTMHYRASVLMADHVAVPKREESKTLNLKALDSKIYDGEVLFHGPQFQTLQTVDGVSDQGSAGELVGVQTLGWSGKGWQTDAVAMDGGLQLALIWSRHVLGGRALPTGVGAYLDYGKGLPEEPIHCHLEKKQVGRNRAVCDITFSLENGDVFAELMEVETHLIPEASQGN